MNKSVAEKWQEALRESGYEHETLREGDYVRLKKFPRVWCRVFRALGLKPEELRRVFEAGCGGGKHLVPFALSGVECTGLDFSREVLARAGQYVDEVRALCKVSLDVNFIKNDFLTYKPEKTAIYDLVFHVGVIEHFCDDAERLTFLKNMFNLARHGGYVVSIVPSGTHPLRLKMKELKLGGYGIPEVDYTPDNMREELVNCGGMNVKVLPHNIFGYLLIDNSCGIVKFLQKLFFYSFQLIPAGFLPYNFAVRHAGALIGIARKS